MALTFRQWDAIYGEQTWDGGKRSLTEQYLIVWNAARLSLLEDMEKHGELPQTGNPKGNDREGT